MGLITAIQNKTEQARAKERIRPLLESRMMRDILLEIGQRGTEKLDPQSVPREQRPLASKRAAECGTAGLQQSVIREIVLDEAAITLFAGSDEVPFLYGDYNYETIDDTDCLPAVAQYLVQHLLGYYNITRTFYSVPKHNGRSVTEKTRQVFIKRHHEDTPFDPQPTRKQKLFYSAPRPMPATHGARFCYTPSHIACSCGCRRGGVLCALRAGPRPPLRPLPHRQLRHGIIIPLFPGAAGGGIRYRLGGLLGGVAQLGAEL